MGMQPQGMQTHPLAARGHHSPAPGIEPVAPSGSELPCSLAAQGTPAARALGRMLRATGPRTYFLRRLTAVAARVGTGRYRPSAGPSRSTVLAWARARSRRTSPTISVVPWTALFQCDCRCGIPFAGTVRNLSRRVLQERASRENPPLIDTRKARSRAYSHEIGRSQRGFIQVRCLRCTGRRRPIYSALVGDCSTTSTPNGAGRIPPRAQWRQR